MGRDNQPKHRQLQRNVVKAANRASHERILIVCEDSKSAPSYFKEIRAKYRLHSANVEVQPCSDGTAPIQVVEYARRLFTDGDPHKRIRPKSFDEVYAVFDRDEHVSYFDAVKAAQSLDGKLENDECNPLVFKAIASIPSFELWLLLHYEDIQCPIHRDEVMRHLKSYYPDYEKGASDVFATTRERLKTASQRAEALATRFNSYTDPEPFTALYELVARLTTLRD